MVRRTRPCNECRTRRMKCDETSPQCLMCSRFGRTCSGLQVGPKIIDVTKDIASRVKKANGRRPGSANIRPVPPRPSSSLDFPTIIIQPDQFPATRTACLEKFLLYFTHTRPGTYRKSWMHQLPSLNSDSFDVLNLSMGATSAIFCALEYGNTPLLSKSRSLYGEALRSLQKSVSNIAQANTIDQIPPYHTICGILLLSFYEAISSTLPMGFCRHVEGAVRILELAGLERCQQGLINQLFFATRVQMILVSALTQKPSLFATASYLQMPYLGRRPPIYERLMSLIIVLLEIYNGHSVECFPSPDGQGLVPVDIANANATLNNLWDEYEKEMSEENKPIAHRDIYTECSTYRDILSAYVISYFSAARLLLNVLLSRTYGVEISKDLVEEPCNSILSYVRFIGTKGPGCAFFRAVFPLLLVACHGLDVQRQEARSYFGRWKGTKTFSGLSDFALVTINQRL